MAVSAIVFDVGETLVDETRQWEECADASGMPRFTYMALAGAAIARGEQPQRLHRAAPFSESDLYPDALPTISGLRERGIRIGAAGNMVDANESFIAPHVDFVASSHRWGVEKPSPEFFARVCEAAGFGAADVVYVGDRVDNDIAPALAFGMAAVHIRRGPWGHLQTTPPGVRRIDSLAELLA
jgi:HAD superfamily hydrolase (TIGR01549 family)